MTATATKIDENTAKISIDGVLGNAIHKEFRAAYEQHEAKRYIVDLSNTTTIDSSGLGMLLLFKDHAGGDDADIEIINCSDHLLDIFHLTCFFRLFKIPEYNKKYSQAS